MRMGEVRNILRISALLLLIPLVILFGVGPSQAAQLNVPSNVVPSAFTSTSIKISFAPVTGSVASYTAFVYVLDDEYQTPVLIRTNYLRNDEITGLTTNKTYRVRMQAIAAAPDTDSELSALSTRAVTLGSNLATPSAPTAVATANTLRSISVSWTAIANASSYTLRLYSSAGTLITTSGLTGLTGTSKTITTSNYPSFANNTAYKVAITAIGNGSTISDSAESAKTDVTTNAAPGAPTITVQPTGQSSTFGSTATFSVTATSPDSGTLGYQWQLSTNSGGSWSNVSTGTGRTSSSYTTASLVMAANGYRYRVNVTNAKNGATSSAVTSSAVVLNVAKADQAPLTSPVLSATSATYNGNAYSQALTVMSASGGSTAGALTITGVVDDTATGCSFSAGTLTASTSGTCTLTVTMAENANYNAVSTTATFTFTRGISTDNTLGSFTVTPGTITPVFSSTSLSYSVSISSTVSTVTITAAPTSQYATMTLNGSTLSPNTPTTVAVDINSTTQVITIRVTAEDLNTTTKDYLISVKRVVNDKTSEVLAPNVTPTPSPVKSTTQRLQTPSVSVLPRINASGGLSLTSGPVGQTIIINGTGFNSLLSVKMNGLRITPNSTSSTSISLTIPTGARSGTFVVTTTKGSVSTPRFTVTPGL
jgi:large repetitive protein